jgi:CBS domain-containing protein
LRIIRDRNVTGVAVVDEGNTLVNDFSASDLKLAYGEHLFDLLAHPLEEFLQRKNMKTPIYVTPNTPLKNVLKVITEQQIHRIFVVDNKKYPKSVITLTDILKFFSSPDLT